MPDWFRFTFAIKDHILWSRLTLCLLWYPRKPRKVKDFLQKRLAKEIYVMPQSVVAESGPKVDRKWKTLR